MAISKNIITKRTIKTKILKKSPSLLPLILLLIPTLYNIEED